MVGNVSNADILSMPQGEGECLMHGPILMLMKCSSETASAFWSTHWLVRSLKLFGNLWNKQHHTCRAGFFCTGLSSRMKLATSALGPVASHQRTQIYLYISINKIIQSLNNNLMNKIICHLSKMCVLSHQ